MCLLILWHGKAYNDKSRGNHLQADMGQAVKYAGQEKGQSIAIVLGTMATCSWPVLVDLTDGQGHHLLALTGNELMVWQDLSPTEAYWKIAQKLKADIGIQDLTSMEADLDKTPETEPYQKAKKLRADIRVVSSLKEQLDSVLPFLSGEEKYQAAFEILATHMASSANASPGSHDGEGFLSMYI